MESRCVYDTLMCIDPGSNTMGITVMKWAKGQPPIITYSQTHRAEAMIRADKYQESLLRYGELTTRLKAHRDNLIRLIKILKPDFVVLESPFFNPRNPSSSEVLVRLKQVLIDVLTDDQVLLDSHWITPQQMKSLIGARFLAGSSKIVKDPVKEALTSLYREGKFKLDEGIDFDTLDEHSLDSIGVGYAYSLLVERNLI